jgi:hypothetical protein
MKFEGAVIKEQGITFAVAIVKKHLLALPTQRDQVLAAFTRCFGGIPVVLMAQDQAGTPTFYGRDDIAKFMSDVPLEAVPWREYSVS